mgnify:FL=1
MEIKFRWYNTKHKKWLYWFYFENRWDWYIATWELLDNPFNTPDDFQVDRWSISQYTRLKDKNDKEIYFWDILATSNSDEDYDLWSKENNWYTVVKEDVYELWINYSKWYMTYDVESIYHFRFCEVIGNIYENYDLIQNN